MKKAIIVLCAFASLALCGCDSPPAVSSPMATPMQKPPESTIVTQTPMPQETEISDEIAQSAILKNGKTFEDLQELMGVSMEIFYEKYSEKVEEIRNLYEYYNEYAFDEFGVTIGIYNGSIKYIDLNRDEIDFCGISYESNFDQVKQILGDTKTLIIEDGLPELKTYELRYFYNDLKLRIFSYSEDGEEGIYISIVEEYVPELRQIRITPQQLNHYFTLSRKELVEELGEGETNVYYKNWLVYEQYGVSFRFDEESDIVIAINTSYVYQIDDLRLGYVLDETMEVMGKRKVYSHDTSEDGPIYYLYYEYPNFTIQIVYFPSDNDGVFWDLINKKYANNTFR